VSFIGRKIQDGKKVVFKHSFQRIVFFISYTETYFLMHDNAANNF
jgi:hypothetical protein